MSVKNLTDGELLAIAQQQIPPYKGKDFVGDSHYNACLRNSQEASEATREACLRGLLPTPSAWTLSHSPHRGYSGYAQDQPGRRGFAHQPVRLQNPPGTSQEPAFQAELQYRQVPATFVRWEGETAILSVDHKAEWIRCGQRRLDRMAQIQDESAG